MNSFRVRILSYLIGFLCLAVLIVSLTVSYRTETALLNAEKLRFEDMLNSINLLLHSEKKNLEMYRENIVSQKKTELRNLTKLVFSFIDNHKQRHERGLTSLKVAQRDALKEISKLKYGNNDYFFVFDKNLKIIAHPKKSLIGIDANKVTDKRGKLHIKEMYEQAIVNGEGSTSYYWDRLGQSGHFEKVGHGVIYKKWDWLIVTGTYVDDIESEVEKRKGSIISSLEKLFKTLQRNELSYTYIFQGDGKILVHPLLKGVNLKGINNPVTGENLFDMHIDAALTERAYEYVWNSPNDINNYKYRKVAFVKKFEPFNWYITHSVYHSDLSKKVVKIQNEIITASILSLIVFSFIGFFVAGAMSSPLKKLSNLVRKIDIKNLKDARVIGDGPKEVQELAMFIHEMIVSINSALEKNNDLFNELELNKDNLENTVHERTLEINQKNENLQKALEDLNKFKNKLVAQEKLASLGTLSAGIAHEIKNPLNLIVNSAKIIAMKVNELNGLLESIKKDERKIDLASLSSDYETLEELSNIIISNSGRSEKIIHSMLQQSRTGEFDDFEIVDIEGIVDEYWGLAFHSMRASNPINVKIHKNISVEKASLIPKDFGRLILNIFENSFFALSEKLKYEEDFIPQVWINIDNVTEESFVVRIKDNGIGIADEAKNKILEPFYTTKPTGVGTGLGLSMVHDIVMAHQGELKISSEEGEFSEFAIILPLGLNRSK
ncbi:MAG: hypothetical protein BM556_10320 [Bacteriovorax sp. MedPE-SWde]|nr:MAG: hypothetical protein BM556_10320 [Bacteriovorax sp. MedPE-SWde]